MKKLTGFTTLFISMVSLQAYAQAPAPPPPPMEQHGQPGGGPGRHEKAEALQPVSAFKGTVTGLISNNDFIYDGFVLLVNGDSMMVHFAPKLGSALMPNLKKGAAITVNGLPDDRPGNGKEVRMVSMEAGGKTIYNNPPAPSVALPADTFTSGSGSIVSRQTDRQGQVTGFILNNKTVLKVSPDVAGQLAASVQTNATVLYSGQLRTVQTGEVAAAAYNVVHCKTITLNGRQYLVR